MIPSVQKNFSVSKFPRSKHTVVTLLKIVGNRAVPGHMLMELDMTWSNDLIAKLRSRGSRVTVTSVLLKAIGVAQKAYPLSRTEVVTTGQAVTYHDIVGGITIEREVKGQQTVFFGEIASPHTLSIEEIASELKQYAQSEIASSPPLALQTLFSCLPWFARNLALELAVAFPYLRLKFQRATFGLTSLGKFGVTSVLSPCICTSTFAVGTIEDRVVVENEQLTIKSMMTLSYNFDQRVLDPQAAGQFVYEVRRLMEGELQQHIDEDARRTGEGAPVLNSEVSNAIPIAC